MRLFKNVFFTTLMLLFISVTMSLIVKKDNQKKDDQKDYSLAKVMKIEDKYVFLNAEPVQDFDIVYQILTFKTGSYNNLDHIANYVMGLALRKKKKEGKDFDAIIVGSTKYDIAIKFK